MALTRATDLREEFPQPDAETPVRVGFVIDTLAPGAGTENQLLLLLDRFDPARVRVSVCCLWDNPELTDLASRYPITVLGFHRLASPTGLRGFRRLKEWIRLERLDLVVTFFRDANIAGTLAGWNGGVPVISSRRNLGRGYWHTRRELLVLRGLNRLTTAFVANSDAVRRYTIEAEGVPAGRISVVPNAIDADRFRPASPAERSKSRRALGLPENGFVVGCVSNLRPIKGVDQLVLAWRAIAAREPNAQLLLVGAGSEEPRLRTLATEGGAGDRVRFLGQRADVAGVLRALDVAVLPSRGESSSNSLLEYIAVGLPVVATAVGGNVELLADPGRGLLVPPEDPDAIAAAVLDLAADEPRRAAIGAAARDFAVSRHSIPGALSLWEHLFLAYANRAPGHSGSVHLRSAPLENPRG